jgi:hypothetical protein
MLVFPRRVNNPLDVAVQVDSPNKMADDPSAAANFCNKIGTFETCRRILKMSVYRGKPEVTGA